jgi:hypothetical protein
MKPQGLLDCFVDVATAVRDALAPIDAVKRRERTNVGGQYALDLVADDTALTVLRKLPVRVVSEESGVHERAGAKITVVLDPVDGSTNCSRGIVLGHLDLRPRCRRPLAALVVNQATGANNGDTGAGAPRRRHAPGVRRDPARTP